MNDHDIRNALTRYAATAPDLDPRAGLAERLARRERRHRAAVAVTACFAAVVAGTGVAALTRDRGTAAVVATGDPTPTVTVATAEPTGDPVVPPDPEPTPTTGPTRPPASSDPTADPSPTESWFGGAGLTVDADVEPTSLPTATSATLRLRIADDDGAVWSRTVDWGDGSHDDHRIVSAPCPGPPDPEPTTRPKQPTSSDLTLTHAWRHDGTYVVRIGVETSTMCAYPRGRPEQAERTFTVTVSQGVVTSNGPVEPAPVEPYGGLRLRRVDSDQYEVEGTVADQDGHVTAVTIDWGDGTTPEQVTNPEPCRDGDGRHYPSSRLYVEEREHQFPAPGRYTVTLSWVSAGCGGADEQRGEKTYTVDVPIGY